jgi:DNA-binding transcriptional LysR family regulator
MIWSHEMAFDGQLLGGIGVLRAVVEARSFVRAGEALGITQSGVSRAVARLEERVGVRLFDRTSRAVSLTDDGRRFYEQVAPLLSGLEAAADQAASSTTTVRGHLRVNVDPWFSQLFLAPRLPAFLAANPELSLELVVRDNLGNLVADGFDAAVRFAEPKSSSLTARLLLRTRILTCAAPSYLARHGTPTHPRALAASGHECLHFTDPTTGRPFTWEFHRGKEVLEVPATGRLLVNDPGTLLSACLAGLGFAQLIEIYLGGLLGKRLVAVFPEWSDERFPLYLIYPSRRLAPAKLRAFSDFVQASAAAADVKGAGRPRRR